MQRLLTDNTSNLCHNHFPLLGSLLVIIFVWRMIPMDKPIKPITPEEQKRTLDEIIQDAEERAAAERDSSGKDKDKERDTGKE